MAIKRKFMLAALITLSVSNAYADGIDNDPAFYSGDAVSSIIYPESNRYFDGDCNGKKRLTLPEDKGYPEDVHKLHKFSKPQLVPEPSILFILIFSGLFFTGIYMSIMILRGKW